MSIDLSLDRLRRFVQYLPPYTRPTFHIAGTNGKGSVSAILTSILCSSTPSLSVGRYNSPHLVSIHDCISINDSTIDAATYSDARSRIEYLDQVHGTKLSKFELLTLTALSIFEKAKVDVVVLEVGMGGRLDATNIIPDESVIVSALTSVDLDHQSFLGTTVAEIAREKAGIARKGRVFVLGPQKHPEVLEAVQDVIRNIGGELVTSIAVAPHMPCFPHDIRATLPLFGDHQLENLGVALTAISALLTHPSAHINIVKSISPKTISRGIQSVRWPGRLSFHLLPAKPKHGITRPLIVLADGAHNSASSATLGSYITHLLSLADVESPVNLTYILSLSHSPPKTPLQTLTPILPPTLPSQSSLKIHVRIACLRFTPPDEMPWVKSVAPEDLRDAVASLTPEAEIWVADGVVGNQLHHALEWAAKENGDGLVVVAGSLYLVADLYRFLQQEKIKVL
ncbi:Folylpolyglutamate synthase [Termitomyces sp. J132]|nr:Folylpolyglutamate synthase [Termitomyces sp. J132]